MSGKPFLVDAIIGNGQTLVTMGSNGQFYRYFWPYIGGTQHLSELQMGVKSSHHHETSWLHDHHWTHTQEYMKGTNIVRTTATNDFLGIRVTLDDFVLPDKDAIIRDCNFENLSEKKNITLVNFSSFFIGGQSGFNGVFFDFQEDLLIHYREQYYFAIGSSIPVTGYQCGNHSFAHAAQGNPIGGEIAMAPDGCLTWSLGDIPQGHKKGITIYICPGTNLQEVRANMEYARSISAERHIAETVEYWQNYLQRGIALESSDARTNEVYERSLLVFGLLSDKNTGAILAAPEIDEGFCRCGGYGFCWVRDAAFITMAMDKAGYDNLAGNFYRWAVQVQATNGSWLQRYHIDGSFAPSWGLQIDETGSVLWGMWQHYLLTGNGEFLTEIWPTIQRAMDFLLGFLDDAGLPRSSYDLWEERKGQHAYSAAAVFGGITGATEIAKVLGHDQQAAEWETLAKTIGAAIIDIYWDDNKVCFFRTVNLEVGQSEYARYLSQGCRADAVVNPKGYVTYRTGFDSVPDVSLLGITEPFMVLPANDERMIMTYRQLREELAIQHTGGFKRYQSDSYIGGNPWIITTLWMALYLIRLEKYRNARDLLYWAADHCTKLRLLPEQIDKDTGQPAWIVPLTWSHAMFVLVALALKEKGQL